MNQKVKLVFPGKPKAVQSFRFANAGNFARKYQPSETVEWKNYIKLLALQQLPEDFSIIENAPIKIIGTFVFPIPSGMKKSLVRAIEAGGIVYHTKKPDLTDNLMKGLSDSLTGIVWKDDSLIAVNNTQKYYGLEPKIILEIETLDTDY